MIKELTKDNQTIKYKVLKKDNKNTYLRFKDDYLEVSTSKRVSDKFIENYLLNNFNKLYIKYQLHLDSIPNDNEIILEDVSYKLKVIPSNVFQIKYEDNKIIVSTRLKDLEKIKRRVYENHLNDMLIRILPEINIVLNKNKIKPLPIRLAYYKAKFGSYNRIKKEVSLNIILAKADIGYLYYVIMHEYAHTKEFNHSKKFYKVLEILMPNYKYYDKTIKKLSIWL